MGQTEAGSDAETAGLAAAKLEAEMFEGTVQLNVQAEGNMGLVVNFSQQLRDTPEFRLLRLANNDRGGVDIWLALREPLALFKILGAMDAVSNVSPVGDRDISAGSEDAPLTVTLNIG